jgi:predicted phage replisome organizer
MAEAEWIKLYLKTFRTSRKISAIERMKNGDTMIVIWFKLLCLAGEINDCGAVYITPKKPFDPVSLADELKKPRAVVDAAIKTFEEHDMLIRDDAGFIQIMNWEKYQNVEGLEKIREQNRKRQKEWYDRQKANANLTLPNAKPNVRISEDVTLPNATEEEGEEDKEFHSFIQSRAREEKYVENKVAESELEGKDAEIYRQELKEGLRRKYIGGELGKGVVFMSDEQFESLCDLLSYDEMEKYFGIIVECETSGKRYKKKTHYQAILDMAMKDRKSL